MSNLPTPISNAALADLGRRAAEFADFALYICNLDHHLEKLGLTLDRRLIISRAFLDHAKLKYADLM